MEFAASVAGLIGLAFQVAEILHKYWSNVHSFSRDTDSLVSEVEALFKVLKRVELFLREGDKGRRFEGTTSVLGSTVNACKDTLTDLKTRLESILGRKFAKLTWPFHKDQVQGLAESLRRYNQIFHFSLTMEGW